jgi:hypothetical protein
MPDLHTRLCPNEAEVAAKVMDGEAILINLSNGMYYSMDQVGASIWEMVVERHTPQEIATGLCGTYNVSMVQAQADVDRLVAELLDASLALATDVAAASEWEYGVAEQLPKLPYVTPELKGYSDMADLLALDPPMPGLEDIPWAGPVQDTAR